MPTINQLFIGLQNQMITSLEVGRSNFEHAPTVGDVTEDNWIDLFRDYLPKRYAIDKAFVIDHLGNISEQIDLVIYDRQYSPFIFNEKSAKYIPAESVYVIFEVKQTLNKAHLEYASNKIASVRKLKRTSAKIPHAGGFYEPKTPNKIIGGILTTESEWKLGLGDAFIRIMNSLTEDHSIELGCAIKDGSFIQNEGELKLSTPEESLIFFFLNILQTLQGLATVPAMDINQYMKALNSYKD